MEKTLLLLLRDAMAGTGAAPDTRKLLLDATDLAGLLGLGEQHNILPLIGPLVLEVRPDYKDTSKLRQIIRGQVVRQVLSGEALCRVTEGLEEKKIDYLVVKGAACRALYPMPDQRPSTDEDILVAPEDMTRAEKVLLELGYTGGIREDGDRVWHFHGERLHLELHQTLSPRPALEARFQACLKTPETFCMEGHTLRTLPPQMHILFLAEHFYKHFIHGGVGIRQVADMVMLLQSSDMDRVALWKDLTELGLEGLMAGVFEIGTAYLGLPEALAAIPEEIQKQYPGHEELLADILDAGVFGASSMERLHAASVTAQAVNGETPTLIGTLFPPRRSLTGRYPYLVKYPWLLPVAWGSRIFGYLGEDKGAARRASDSTALGKRRLKLMEDYGLLRNRPE